MMLDGRGVQALGKVAERRKLQELQDAHVLCAPSLGGESFGMVLTEAFAAATPVLASDIPGYRDVLRDGEDGVLVPPATPSLWPRRCAGWPSTQPRRQRMAIRAASAPSASPGRRWPPRCPSATSRPGPSPPPPAPSPALPCATASHPADRQPRIPAERIPSLQDKPVKPAPAPAGGRADATPGGARCLHARRRSARRAGPPTRRRGPRGGFAGGLQAGAGRGRLGLMCTAMFVRAIAWHAILAAAPTWRRAKRRDAMQGTFIGVLMSATLPARLGEPSRALIVARRLGRARETLPVVLGTMVSQALLNLLALALLAAAMLATADFGELERHERPDPVRSPSGPLAALFGVPALRPVLIPPTPVSRSPRLQRCCTGAADAR